MAIAPKVKFKTIATVAAKAPDLTWGADPSKAFSITDILPTQEPPNYHKLPDIWLILVYTTKYDTDTLEQYTLLLHEIQTSVLVYTDRIITLKHHLKFELDGGNINGYYLYGYKVTPEVPGGLELLSKKHMFQVTKKVYLNGPLKDNAFLQKKGKHHA